MRKALLIFLLSTGVVACSSGPEFSPLTSSGSGYFAEQIVHANDRGGYVAYLAVMAPEGMTTEQFKKFDSDVAGISGGAQDPPKPHRGLRLMLEVSEIKGGRRELVRRTAIHEEPEYASGSGALWLILGALNVSRGDYLVSVHSLEPDPRYSKFKFALSVGASWK